MATVLPDPFYYLENFRQLLMWVGARHGDLLDARERDLIARFQALPPSAQALLVRMVMRKGELFRQSKLVYAEIGDVAPLAALLAERGLIEAAPALSLAELAGLLRKDELQQVFYEALRDPRASGEDGGTRKGGAADTPADPRQDGAAATGKGLRKRTVRKEDLLAHLAERFPQAQPLAHWSPDFGEAIYRLLHPELYDLLRLLFFGNLHQDWSEFVLADLGLLRYETVEISVEARAFQSRADVDAYLRLHALRTRLEDGDAPAAVLAEVPGTICRSGFSPTAMSAVGDAGVDGGVGLKPDLPGKVHFANAWLEERRGRLLFQIGQQLEREKDWLSALAAYQASGWPEARIRAIRVLEQDGQPQAAFELAQALLADAPREEERQQLARMLPRLRRKLGLAPMPADTLLAPERLDLVLEPIEDLSVEWVVQAHLQDAAAPVFYVENALINSLFGLLCWPALFAPVPGAFFHAFHYGPVDLHSPDFEARRAREFAHCLGLLDSAAYREVILDTWRTKQGLQSPFVFWDVLNEELLALALDCIPPDHLKALFARLLADLKNNRSGFPDLIRFWPAEKRYLMLEVKGPGDRLQDNQVRWLDYCLRHGIPVAVSHVSWAE